MPPGPSIYQYDLENRFPNDTLSSFETNDLVTWELKDGSGNVIDSARGMKDDNDEVIKKLRRRLGIDDHVAPMLDFLIADSEILTPGEQYFSQSSNRVWTKGIGNNQWS